MSLAWQRSLLLGIVIFFYTLAAQNFWPDLNMYLNALFAALLGGVTVKISEIIFQE